MFLLSFSSWLTLLVRQCGRVLCLCAGDYYDRWNEFLNEVTPLVRDGKIKHQETIMDGFEKLPEALAGLFKGINIGKVSWQKHEQSGKQLQEENNAAEQERIRDGSAGIGYR